jgi:small conductance mechanosensitive channel
MDWQSILNNVVSTVINWVSTAGLRLILALIILFISFKIINAISRRIERSGDKGKLDKTLARTFAYVFKIGLKVIVLVCMVGFVGIDTSGLAALLVSVGACVGLALNGALSNLAGGILIILTRPFKVDDFIEAQGYSGTVEDIHITNTKLRTPDNKVVYIPNGPLSSGNIVNYSVMDTRRVDFSFSIGYGDDFERAKKIITDICTAHELVLKDPAPMVRVSEHGANSINRVTRVWVKRADYWTVNFDILEAVKAAFEKEGIEIPFNQLDVHVKKDQ